MKLKYYLRGAGVGILVTTLIFIIAFAFYEPQLTDEEIEAKAKQLGMVMAEDEDTKDADNKDANADESKDAGDATDIDGSGDTTDDATVQPTEFVINSGEDSSAVVQRLYAAGLIDNEAAFDTYLDDNSLDNLIQPGTVHLRSGMTYEEIANAIITKQENRTAQ